MYKIYINSSLCIGCLLNNNSAMMIILLEYEVKKYEFYKTLHTMNSSLCMYINFDYILITYYIIYYIMSTQHEIANHDNYI